MNFEENQSEIGSGNTSVIYLIRKQIEGVEKVYVQKQFKPLKQKYLIHEKNILEQCGQQQNIITMLSNIGVPQENSLYLQFMSKGDLFAYAISISQMDYESKQKLIQNQFRGLLEAVAHIHEQNIVHRDIKLDNIFVDQEENFVLGDFGYADEITENTIFRSYCGTEGYAAPEIEMKQPYMPQPVDVFALGVTLFNIYCSTSMITKKACPTDNMYKYFSAGKGNMIFDALRQKHKMIISPELEDIITRMVDPVPQKRPTIKEVLNSRFFQAVESKSEVMEEELNIDSI